MSNEELKIKCIELVTPNLASQMDVDRVIENAQKVYDFISVGNERVLNASETVTA